MAGGADDIERPMTAHSPNAHGAPDIWDRCGLPGWTYHSQALFDLERTKVFLTHWQLAGHTADLPGTGDWLGFDLLGERAVVMRGSDGVIRAFHNLCRHRGARVVDGASGIRKSAIVCPFHGWVYNLDGTLRGVAQPESFGTKDRGQFGLKPIEMQIWHGFIFLRFAAGPQPDVADWLSPYATDFAAFRLGDLAAVTTPGWATNLPVNWKSLRDVDNEGYNVPLAHPALQELYGRSYANTHHGNGLAQSNATFGDWPGRRWSVRNYVKTSPVQDWQPAHLQRA